MIHLVSLCVLGEKQEKDKSCNDATSLEAETYWKGEQITFGLTHEKSPENQVAGQEIIWELKQGLPILNQHRA